MPILLDPKILQLAQKGNLWAFEQILLAYEKPLYNYIYRNVGHQQTAEDLTQDTFVKVYKNLKKIKPNDNFKSWLYTIATNTVYDFHRKKHHVTEIFIIDDPESNFETIAPEQTYTIVEKISAAEDVNKALEALKPEFKTVLLLFYKNDFSYEQIASILNKPINTVKTYLHRAKKALKDELTDDDIRK